MKKLWKRKGITLVCVALLFSFVLVSCGEQKTADTEETTGTATAPKEKRHYYYIGAVNAHPYFLDAFLGVEYAKKRLGVDITVLGPNDFDMTAMVAAIEQTIPKKPDGILTMAWDSTPVPAIKKAMAAGIPVITMFTTVPDSGALTYIGLDNYQSGVVTGRELLKRGGNSGKLGIIMNAGASNTEAKKAGALAALEGAE